MMSDLKRAGERLQQLEQLLLQPTPEAIREANTLLQEVAALVAECRAETNLNAQDHTIHALLNDFRIRCERVAKLLEGARRAQWIRMRLITSLTQTYTARAEAKIWPPPSGTVNIRM